MKRNFILFFPQWHGAGTRDLYDGALEIRDLLLQGKSYEQVPVTLEDELTVKKDILGYDPINAQLAQAVQIIKDRRPPKIFTIGGDCSVELAPVSYLNQRYDRDLAVLWFDAHGDLNTPQSSPSKHFHGMPLRFLLGEGEETMMASCFSSLTPDFSLTPAQVIMVGCRELDPPEEKYIQDNRIPIISKDQLATLTDQIRRMGFKNVYIHLDLDVIDPVWFPWVLCPAKQGIDSQSLMAALESVNREFNLVGFSILEYSRSKNCGGKPANCMKHLKAIFDFGLCLSEE